MKKLKQSKTFQKLLLAVWFVLGGTCTFELGVDRIQENKNLYAIMTILAVVFDFLFFKTLFSLAKERAFPMLAKTAGKTLAFLFRGLAKLAEKVSDTFSREHKTFMEGKNERSFVFEMHHKQAEGEKRKLPKLGKDASEREKIRHAYASYVFRKNKNVSSALTPNEVARELDRDGEDREIFEMYNEARYTEE